MSSVIITVTSGMETDSHTGCKENRIDIIQT